MMIEVISLIWGRTRVPTWVRSRRVVIISSRSRYMMMMMVVVMMR